MAREWQSRCKDCNKEFGYSDASYQAGNLRGLSRPERCPECRRLHSREIATLGLSHFELTPVRPLPPEGLRPGRLGGLTRPKRVHEVSEQQTSFDLTRFGIKDDHIREFLLLMQKHQVMVIVAPTGSGKSTFLPYRLIVPPSGFPSDLLTRHGQIVVTQPRIQATRNIPAFVAHDLHGSSLGAGYDVGFRHSGNPATDWRNKLVYLTDGTLINMIVRNELGRLSVIMIDEAHERSLNIDLILGLLKAQLPRYPHLKVIIASATINTQLFVGYYGGPEGFNPDDYKTQSDVGELYDNAAIALQLEKSPAGFYGFPGKRQYPVETRYWEDDPIPPNQWPGRMPDEVARKVVEILHAMAAGDEPIKGDILAFLHGEQPIERAVASIRDMVDDDERLANKVAVLPLYTKLPQHQQDAALKPKKDKNKWRVVVSTNVAETSLTVEGIVHVVDSGLINESQWDSQSQTSYVVPKIHSQAGCIQRWGRAGRIQAGVAHCLYTKEQFETFRAHTDPEIMRAPLDQIVLTAKAAGINDLKRFDWIQRPPEVELDRAPLFLKQIGALDRDGDLTDHGLELRNTAEEIDVANLMILADQFGCAVEMATLIAMNKVGGYTSFLLWDRSWDAPTKRGVHRIHRGLLAPCTDDLEFYLKLWSAWEGDPLDPAVKKHREAWARRFFVNHTLFRDQIAPERNALLTGLSGHRKDEGARALDFNLLTRLRIVMTYGLANQVYQLANPPVDSQVLTVEAVYKPYIADPEANPELVHLHENAKVEISPESVCFGNLPDHFVCGRRQRVRRRVSPQAEPLTIITASFLTLIKPAWLRCVGEPPIAVARLISAETRDPRGHLIATTTRKRLLIDQAYPVGAVFDCAPTEDGKQITVGAMKTPPPRLRTGRSYEEIEAVDAIEVLTAEGALSETAGADPKAHQVVFDPEAAAERPLWDDLLSEGEESFDRVPLPTHTPSAETIVGGQLTGLGDRAWPTGPFEGIVAGYDFRSTADPTLLLELPIRPDPFESFRQRYKVGDDLQVKVVAIERYINDWLLYLIVQEVATGLEIVLDPYDASLIGRNFALEILEPGTELTVTIEEIDVDAHAVRVTRLKAAEAAMLRLLGRESERLVDAQIVDVRDNGLYLWLDPVSMQSSSPCCAFARLERLPNRPEEMSVGNMCKVRVRANPWKRPLRRTISADLDADEEKLRHHHWNEKLSWDDNTHTLTVGRRLTYGDRISLFQLSAHSEFRRSVNILFRRSNELDVRVIDMTGLQNLVAHKEAGAPMPAKVVTVRDDVAFVALPDGLEVPIPKREIVYDSSRDLHEVLTEGAEVGVRVKSIDLEQGQAALTMLRPEDDPLNDYREGQIVHGHVTNVREDGALVELSPGAQGMVFIGELAWRRIDRPADVVRRGQTVKVQVLSIDRERRHLNLTMRLPESDPLNKYQENQRLPGKVVGFTKDGTGAFVELEPGAEGYLYKDEASLERVRDVRQILTESQTVVVRITEIDRGERRLRVTIRGLYEAVVQLPTTHIRLVIGKSGARINSLMHETGTYIEVDDEGICLIQGLSQQSVQSAERRVATILATRIVAFTLDGRQTGMLIGKGGSTINAIQTNTGAQIDVGDGGQVTVTAADDGILRRVLNEIEAVIRYCEATVQVPTHLVGRVIGRGGQTIQSIRDQTGVRLDVAKDGSGTIRIEGRSSFDIDRAVQLIQIQTGSATYLSRKEAKLPPISDVRSAPARPSAPRLRRGPTPPVPAPTVTPPTQAKPASAAAPVQPRPTSSLSQMTIRTTAAQLESLTRKQGGFFAAILGLSKTPLEKIQIATLTQIRVDPASGVLTVTGQTKESVEKAVQQIRAHR